jgi:hypothetical protein
MEQIKQHGKNAGLKFMGLALNGWSFMDWLEFTAVSAREKSPAVK